MKKVYHFDSSRDPYTADAAVVWCFDARFHLGFTKFLKRRGVVNLDAIKIAGGAKALASPTEEKDRDFVLDQIRASIRLHQTKRVILMLHSDCGAYGGLACFDNDSTRESRHHARELKAAADYLRERLPGIELEAYFVDFEGVWAVNVDAAKAVS